VKKVSFECLVCHDMHKMAYSTFFCGIKLVRRSVFESQVTRNGNAEIGWGLGRGLCPRKFFIFSSLHGVQAQTSD